MKKIILLDTTLRDGEQSPGMVMTPDDKLAVALMLESAGVDIIEAGFPVSSARDFEAVNMIAGAIKSSAVCALARCVDKDIERVAEAIKNASGRYIHLTLGTSPIQRQNKLHMSCGEIIKRAVDSVLYAKKMCDFVEMGAEDATRTEPEFLRDFFIAVTEAGADVINIADTSGYALPAGFAELTSYILRCVPRAAAGTARVSVHCHNDLGLALANTLAGITAGASQAEATLLGIGERAGNAALEELSAVMKVRGDAFAGYTTGINNKILIPACELVSSIEGIAPGANKPLAGRNTFSHSSGIHQDGILKFKPTYEIIEPADFGGGGSEIVLSRHSGKRGVASKVEELLGFDPDGDIMADIMREYEKISGGVKSVSRTALLRILKKASLYNGVIYTMLKVSMTHGGSGKNQHYCARVDLKVNETRCPGISAENKDPFDALFSVLGSAMPWGIRIRNYSCGLFGAGQRMSATTAIQAEAAGKLVRAESYAHDIYTAAAEAYIDIANYAAAAFKQHMHDAPEFGAAKGL
jgi:2-isopropylmalate synthase